MSKEKSIILRSSAKAYFWQYAAGILLIPVLAGFYLLWKLHQKRKNTYYKITDHSITAIKPPISETFDLVDIKHVRVEEKIFNTGHIFLNTASREMVMEGLENPAGLKNSIEKAIAMEHQRLEHQKQVQPREVKFAAGEMERMDYLTGLWQQGLISDEDFEREK